MPRRSRKEILFAWLLFFASLFRIQGEDHMDNQEFTLISASNELGRNFIKVMKATGEPVAALVNNVHQQREMDELGINTIVRVDTKNDSETLFPPVNIGKVYLFEDSLPLICRYMIICRPWTSKKIFVITKTGNIPSVYKKLGADHIVLTNGKNVSFLFGMQLDGE